MIATRKAVEDGRRARIGYERELAINPHAKPTKNPFAEADEQWPLWERGWASVTKSEAKRIRDDAREQKKAERSAATKPRARKAG